MAQILAVDAHGSPRQSRGSASRFSVVERSSFVAPYNRHAWAMASSTLTARRAKTAEAG